MGRWVRFLSFSLLLMLAGSCLAGYAASVKLADQNKLLLLNGKFYNGPGKGSTWTSRDSYETEGDKLLNKTRKQYLQLTPVPTITIKKVFKRDELLTDEYIVLLASRKLYFVKTQFQIKAGYSEEFFIDGRLLIDSEGHEFELQELTSWECQN